LLTADFWELTRHKQVGVMANKELKLAPRGVIEQLKGEKNTFDSHEIITRFMKLHKCDHVGMLNSYVGNID
jgi:hypothetical protein